MTSALKAAVVAPAVICGFFLARNSNSPVASVASSPAAMSERVSVHQQPVAVSIETSREAIALRRVRLARLLQNIDVVAALAKQMSPERSAQIEMVLEEMTSQCIELASDKSLRAHQTDEEISDLEKTLNRLVVTFARTVEPELSL